MVKRRNDLSSFIGSSNNTRAEAEKEMIDRQISSIEKKLPITVLDDNGEAMETGEQANEEDIAVNFPVLLFFTILTIEFLQNHYLWRKET